MPPVKHFLVNPSKVPISKEIIGAIQSNQETLLRKGDEERFLSNEKLIEQEDNLRCVEGKVIIKIDLVNKNFHTFANGSKIRLERQFNNFNQRETQPVNAIVIDSTYIPKGSQILIHPNSIHDSSRIFNYKDNNSDVKYYSIGEEMCYAYYDKEWLPLTGFDFALRVFKPYEGLIGGIEPEKIKECLYVTTGELKGKAVLTIIACDYEIVFMDKNGREGNLIRFRPFGDKKTNREEEAILILDEVTEKINKGKYLVGLTTKDARPIVHND